MDIDNGNPYTSWSWIQNLAIVKKSFKYQIITENGKIPLPISTIKGLVGSANMESQLRMYG